MGLCSRPPRRPAKTATHQPARRTAAPRAARQRSPPLLLRAHRPQRFLDELRDVASRHGCAIHAYVLMNHPVHLLLTSAAIGWVSAMRLRWRADTSATSMLATAAPAPFGKAASRPARCTPTITCCAAAAASNLIRSVRAGSAKPAAKPGRATPQTRRARSTRSSAHPQSLALDAEDTARKRLNREWVQSAITPNEVAPDEVDDIRRRLTCQHAFGTVRFRQRIEAPLQRRAGPAKIGRSRKSAHHSLPGNAL